MTKQQMIEALDKIDADASDDLDGTIAIVEAQEALEAQYPELYDEVIAERLSAWQAKWLAEGGIA